MDRERGHIRPHIAYHVLVIQCIFPCPKCVVLLAISPLMRWNCSSSGQIFSLVKVKELTDQEGVKFPSEHCLCCCSMKESLMSKKRTMYSTIRLSFRIKLQKSFMKWLTLFTLCY
jgi:hypothetical protein